jgi:hypothetical protein
MHLQSRDVIAEARNHDDQLDNRFLVTQPGSRRYEQLSVDDLVPVAVVGQRVDIVDGPLPRKLWHMHTIDPPLSSKQVRMPYAALMACIERHRDTAAHTIVPRHCDGFDRRDVARSR